MAPSLTVTMQASNTPPRIQLQIAGFGGSTVRITRVNADGTSYVVRTANPGQVTTGAWYDYESPWTQAGTYTAVADNGDTATATAAALGITKPWLLHVGVPTLSMPITVAEYGERTRAVTQGVHKVLGRSTPVVVTDGVRQEPTFDLTVRTASTTERAALAKLLSTATPLLLQIVYPSNPRVIYHYVAVGDVVEADVINLSSQYIAWTLPCTVVDSPSGLQQAAWTWAGVQSTYTSWDTVKQRFTTWTNVLINKPKTT